MTNPIDSLPATPETVGMPRHGDVVICNLCGDVRAVEKYEADDERVIECHWCPSYDAEKVKP